MGLKTVAEFKIQRLEILDPEGKVAAHSALPAVVGSSLGDPVSERAVKADDPLVQEITIKASGCPNGCGQHHLGAIGLQGSSFKAGQTDIPCYDVFLGGGNYIGGGKFGTRVARVPVKRMPQAIAKIIGTYQAERGDGERQP